MGDDYPRALERYARRLGLGDAVRLTGSVSDEALAAYYASLRCVRVRVGARGVLHPDRGVDELSVSLWWRSTRERFPGTAGNGALVVDDKSPLALAAAAHKVTKDQALRAAISRSSADRGPITSPWSTGVSVGPRRSSSRSKLSGPSCGQPDETSPDRSGGPHPCLQRRDRDPRARMRKVLRGRGVRVGDLRGGGPS